MPGGSRIVFDLTGPAKIAKSYVLEAANGQPPRLVLELEEVDRTAFVQSLAPRSAPNCGPQSPTRRRQRFARRRSSAEAGSSVDGRPVVVIDPGHGGIDNGTQSGGESEKNLVLAFGLALRDRLEKTGKYRVVMTRNDDTFIPLDDRVKSPAAVGRAVRLDPCRRAAAAPRAMRRARPSTRCRQGLRRRGAAAGGCGKPRRRHRRCQSGRRADRRRRHPDRPRAARNPHLFKPFRPPVDGRDEVACGCTSIR